MRVGLSFIVAGFLACNTAFAAFGTDMSNQNSRTESSSDSKKNSVSTSKNQSNTKSETQNQGAEKSYTDTLTRNLSETSTATKSVTRSTNGAWSISLSPVAYLFIQLKQMGWDREAFSLTPKDLGISYFVDNEDEVVDVAQRRHQASKAEMQSKLTAAQQQKVAKAIQTLYITSQLLERAIGGLTASKANLDLSNIKDFAGDAIKRAYNAGGVIVPEIYNCRWGGNQNTFTCNDGEWTLILNPSIPQLLHFGTAVYSANQVGHATPMLTITIANNDSDAFSIAGADSRSKATADAIRAYTSKLKSEGKSDVASKITQASMERAFTSGLNKNHNDVMQAINGNSPSQLLSILK